MAFLAALHVLCLKLFYRYTPESCLDLDVKSVVFGGQAPGLNDSAVANAVDERHRRWSEHLPCESADLWDALWTFDPDSRNALFAHCVALSCLSACNIDPLSRGIGVQNCPPTDWSVALPALERSRWWGMLIVETIARIRREHFIKGKTIKEIVRDLKVSRNTVRKVLRSGETSFEYERQVQPRPKLGRWAVELDGLLAANAAKSVREQLTLIRIFEELRGRGYDGGYDAVRRYARRWSKERGQSTAAAYVPLSFAPGEAYQFDWSHEVVLLSGTTVVVKVAHVRLCHSRMLFARAYPRETQEMVFEAHDRAFALFKGTCSRGIYDNMKTAVETIFVGKGRLYNRRFMQMCSHYLVDPVACTPASGWEKGQVENQVGLVRERFFTPRLRFKNLNELNAWLLDKCIAYAKAHRHPELADQTIWEVFEAERPKLVPYAGRFEASMQ